MASIEDSVLESFFDRISNDPSVTDSVANELRTVLGVEEKLPTADQIAQIFIRGSGDALA